MKHILFLLRLAAFAVSLFLCLSGRAQTADMSAAEYRIWQQLSVGKGSALPITHRSVWLEIGRDYTTRGFGLPRTDTMLINSQNGPSVLGNLIYQISNGNLYYRRSNSNNINSAFWDEVLTRSNSDGIRQALFNSLTGVMTIRRGTNRPDILLELNTQKAYVDMRYNSSGFLVFARQSGEMDSVQIQGGNVSVDLAYNANRPITRGILGLNGVNLGTNNIIALLDSLLFPANAGWGALTGDLSGTLNNPSVVWLNGYPTYDARYIMRADSSISYYTKYQVDSILEANSAKFKYDVVVNGPTGTRVGKYTNGQTIPAAGKTLDEFLTDIAVQAVAPTYSAPSAGIGSSPEQGSYEIGSAINITLGGTYNQNDGGSATTYTYAKYISAWNNLASNTDNITSLTQTTYYRVTIAYNQGPCKLNNLGQVDCTGRIDAGSTTSGNLTFTPYPKAYVGYTQNATVSASDVLSAATQYLSGGRTGTITWNTPSGADIWPFYAYPVSFGAVAGATDFFTGASIDINQFFVQQTIVSFTNAQGFTQSYYVYRFTNKQPQNTQIKINIQ